MRKSELTSACGHHLIPEGLNREQKGRARMTLTLCLSSDIHALPLNTGAPVYGTLNSDQGLHLGPLTLRPSDSD